MASNMEMNYQNFSRRYRESVGQSSAVHDGHAHYSRMFRMAVLCLGVMCILQASLNIALRLYFTYSSGQTISNISIIIAERNQLQQELIELDETLSHTSRGIRYFSSSLYYSNSNSRNWTASRDECKMSGSDLLIINSREEQEFIARAFGFTAWIGLSDTETEGEWKWVDGSELTIKFWTLGEPNSFGGKEDCASTAFPGAKSLLFSWADYPCDLIVTGICEKRLTNQIV